MRMLLHWLYWCVPQGYIAVALFVLTVYILSKLGAIDELIENTENAIDYLTKRG